MKAQFGPLYHIMEVVVWFLDSQPLCLGIFISNNERCSSVGITTVFREVVKGPIIDGEGLPPSIIEAATLDVVVATTILF